MLPQIEKEITQDCIDAVNNLLSVSFLDKSIEELPYLLKPRNIKAIEIEGIDNSGKETLAKNLSNHIYDIANRKVSEYNLYDKNQYKYVYPIVISFPDYASIYGRYLKEILRSEELQEKIPNWRELYYYDFYNTIEKIYSKANSDPNTLFIVIFDRYVMSNTVYKCLDLYNEKDFETYVFDLTPRRMPVFDAEGKIIQGEFKEDIPVKPAEDSDEYFNAIASKILYINQQALQDTMIKLHSNMEESDEIYQRLGGLVDMTVFLSVFKPEIIKEYKKALEEKEGKDLNESFMKQMFLAMLYNYISDPMVFDKYAMQITKSIPMTSIEYKSNWNTNKYEAKLFNILLSIL